MGKKTKNKKEDYSRGKKIKNKKEISEGLFMAGKFGGMRMTGLT